MYHFALDRSWTNRGSLSKGLRLKEIQEMPRTRSTLHGYSDTEQSILFLYIAIFYILYILFQ